MNIDYKNVLMIALIAFVSVWLINKGLATVGLSKYKA